MPQVVITRHIQRYVACPPETVPGSTVREVLENLFSRHPGVRGYVFNDQDSLRKHVVIFVNGEQVVDREYLSDAVSSDAELYIMQALSGG